MPLTAEQRQEIADILECGNYNAKLANEVAEHRAHSLNATISGLGAELDLSALATDPAGNTLDDVHALTIAELIRMNTTLTGLTLNNNSFTSDSMAGFGDALKNNTTLKKLSLANNPLGNEGINNFVAILGEEASITSLNIRGCGCTDNVTKDIITMLEKNPFITEIDARDNGLTLKSKQQITSALRKNKMQPSQSQRRKHARGDDGAGAGTTESFTDKEAKRYKGDKEPSRP